MEPGRPLPGAGHRALKLVGRGVESRDGSPAPRPVSPVKPCTVLLAACVALAVPAAVLADTIYFVESGASRIQSVSGTIVRETRSAVEVSIGNGQTVSIPRDEVVEIIRDTSPAPGPRGFETADEAGSAAGSWDYGRRLRSSSKPAYHMGIKAGMNVSNMSVDPQELEDGNSLKSYAVGAWWNVPFGRRLALQAEALYSVKGDAESDDGYTASTRMGYIDVPVLAKIGFLHGSPARPSLFLGPLLSLNVSAKSTLEGGGSDIDVNVKDQVRPLDLGLVVGGGVDFPVAGRTFGLDLRYSRGLGNALGDDANGTARNDVIAVMGSIGLQ